MTPLLGVDVSRWQPVNLPWREWRAGGLTCACIQITHGSRLEEHGGEHLGGAIAAGVASIGLYHYLTPGAALWQAQVFIAALAPGVTWAMLDVEEFGIVAGDVLDFCDWFDAHSALPLYLYGNNALAKIMADNPRLTKYKVWWAEYANKLPTTQPPYAAPKYAPKWMRASVAAWQFTGTGRLPPYGGAIDLSVWYETPGVKPMSVPIVATGSKLGIHSIAPGTTIPLVRRALAAGWHWPLVKILHDASVCADVKAISPQTLTICRYMPDSGDEGLQDVNTWSLATMQAWAKRLIDLIFARTPANQMAAVDYWDVTNEPGAHGVGYYRALGLAFIELVKLADARGVHLSLPALPQGVPEWDEMQALVETGLFGLMKRGGHIWDSHEGAFVDQPVDFGFGDVIPGAPAEAGAGSTSFRHKYLYRLLEQRNEVVPLVISEFYGGGRYSDAPASQLARFAWYDVRARAEPYLLAFCPFTLNPDGGWHDQDYGPTYASPEFWNYIAAEKNLPNATGDDTVDTQKAIDAIRQARGQLDTALAALVVTWKAGDIAVAVADPLTTYNAAGGSIHDIRPHVAYDLNVQGVSADELWLQVAPALWVKASAVKHKGG